MYDENWFDTAEYKMCVYFAVCIIMTVVKKPTLKMKCPKKSIV
jgi:hypothetical protein